MTVAVVDVETTGLSPRTDRVVEVGVVLLDDRGEVEFETLLDPGRDVGPTAVHGIRASDVVEAPAFADVAPYLRSLLAGRVVVAHNALFDLRFLAPEFGRAGLPVELPPTLCTMRLAPLFLARALARCRRCATSPTSRWSTATRRCTAPGPPRN